MSTWLRQFVAVVVLVSLLLAFVFWPGLMLKREATQLIGASEADVVTKLGTPYSVITAQNVAERPTSRWLAEGWSPVPVRPVTNKVFVYYSTFVGALVYIDPAGRVDYIHIVGT